MTLQTLVQLFNNGNSYLVNRPKNPDLEAMKLLVKRFNHNGDIIFMISSNTVFFSVKLENDIPLLEEDIEFLKDCGVSYDKATNLLILYRNL